MNKFFVFLGSVMVGLSLTVGLGLQDYWPGVLCAGLYWLNCK